MNKQRLPHDGAEYVHFSFDPAVPTDATIEASVDGGAWTGVERPAGTAPRMLLRGPDAPAGTGTRVLKDSVLRVRVIDVQEVVVRTACLIAIVR